MARPLMGVVICNSSYLPLSLAKLAVLLAEQSSSSSSKIYLREGRDTLIAS